MDVEDQTPIPLYRKVDGEWTKIGEGVYNRKDATIVVEQSVMDLHIVVEGLLNNYERKGPNG